MNETANWGVAPMKVKVFEDNNCNSISDDYNEWMQKNYSSISIFRIDFRYTDGYMAIAVFYDGEEDEEQKKGIQKVLRG